MLCHKTVIGTGRQARKKRYFSQYCGDNGWTGGLFGAGTTFKGPRRDIGQVVRIAGEALSPTVKPQQTFIALTFNEKTIVGAGGRRDPEGSRTQRTGRQDRRRVHRDRKSTRLNSSHQK